MACYCVMWGWWVETARPGCASASHRGAHRNPTASGEGRGGRVKREDGEILLGWTACWCSGCAAWTETLPCRSQACGASSGRPCTSPTRGHGSGHRIPRTRELMN